MGQIERWARIGGAVPWLANLVTRTPGLAALSKWAGGIAQARTMPAFSSPSFRRWHRHHTARDSGERVVLWPDTFNNYFRSETAIAATELLEGLGFRVEIPQQPLCCGRPLYDWGWLDQAKALWRQTMNTLADDIRAGTPIIGLEPACISAFRDELVELFPGDPAAQALSKQTVMLSEFLQARKIPVTLPSNGKRALVQFHCHHHAVLDRKAEESADRPSAAAQRPYSMPAAAAWPDPSVSRRENTICRCRSANASCSRQSEKPPRTR